MREGRNLNSRAITSARMGKWHAKKHSKLGPESSQPASSDFFSRLVDHRAKLDLKKQAKFSSKPEQSVPNFETSTNADQAKECFGFPTGCVRWLAICQRRNALAHGRRMQ